VASITTIATLVCIYNDVFCNGYTDFSGLQCAPLANLPAISLPALPFNLASPSLGLLLVFKTNAAYGRWAEGRKQWGVMGTECRNVMRMAASWSSPMREPDKQKRVAAIQSVGTACYTFMRSLLRHVSGPPDEEDFQKDLRAALPEKEAEAIIAAGHRPFRALFLLSRRIEALPLSERQRIEVDKSCVIIGDTCGGTERVYGTPIPLSYTRHTSRFLTVWLMGLPLALYDGFANTWNHIGMIPAASLIAVFLYGIEELSVYLEEPFSILALPGMVQAMKNFSEQLPEWHAMYTEGEYSDKVYGGEEYRNPSIFANDSKEVLRGVKQEEFVPQNKVTSSPYRYY
jgi:predicted membrane chloride channel (bestrophin family)